MNYWDAFSPDKAKRQAAAVERHEHVRRRVAAQRATAAERAGAQAERAAEHSALGAERRAGRDARRAEHRAAAQARQAEQRARAEARRAAADVEPPATPGDQAGRGVDGTSGLLYRAARLNYIVATIQLWMLLLPVALVLLVGLAILWLVIF